MMIFTTICPPIAWATRIPSWQNRSLLLPAKPQRDGVCSYVIIMYEVLFGDVWPFDLRGIENQIM